MARDTSPQCKQCRREGQKLFLKGERCFTDKCGVERRSYPPGEHGRGRLRQSEYRLQLREKQKTRRYYQVLEKQFRAYYDKASRQDGVTGENLLRLLESPLRQRPRPPRLRRLAAPGAAADHPRPLDDQRPPGRHPELPGEVRKTSSRSSPSSGATDTVRGATELVSDRAGLAAGRPRRPHRQSPAPPRALARSRRRSRSSSSSSCTPSSTGPSRISERSNARNS